MIKRYVWLNEGGETPSKPVINIGKMDDGRILFYVSTPKEGGGFYNVVNETLDEGSEILTITAHLQCILGHELISKICEAGRVLPRNSDIIEIELSSQGQADGE